MGLYKLENLKELLYALKVKVDIEFYLRGVRYNISWENHKPFICTCPDGDAVFFNDGDDLLKNYKVDGTPIGELWREMDIYSM